MSSMMEATDSGQMSQAGVSQFTPTASKIQVRRMGERPLSFEGSELAMAMSYTPTIPYWYEINLYRTSDQQFVAAVRLFHQSEDKQNAVQAWQLGSLDEAIHALATYDAAQDVSVEIFFDAENAPAAELAAHAMHLQARVSSMRQHYQSLVGEFLYELENSN